MTTVVWVALIGWLIVLAIFCGFIVLLRYIEHRERMALIARGIDPYALRRHRRGVGVLRAGLIIAMVGLALTIGLYPLGFMSLVISYYLGQDNQPPRLDLLDEPQVKD